MLVLRSSRYVSGQYDKDERAQKHQGPFEVVIPEAGLHVKLGVGEERHAVSYWENCREAGCDESDRP